jgi:hypothetical protein
VAVPGHAQLLQRQGRARLGGSRARRQR